MFRDRLIDEAPAAAAELDALMLAYGQRWILDSPAIDPHALLTAHELAEWADISRSTINKWVQRGNITRRRDADNRTVYLVADVIEYQKRRKRHADTSGR